MLLRSDVFDLGEDGRLHSRVDRIPEVDLGGAYKLIDDYKSWMYPYR